MFGQHTLSPWPKCSFLTSARVFQFVFPPPPGPLNSVIDCPSKACPSLSYLLKNKNKNSFFLDLQRHERDWKRHWLAREIQAKNSSCGCRGAGGYLWNESSVGMVQGDGVRAEMVKSETHFHWRSRVAGKEERGKKTKLSQDEAVCLRNRYSIII